MTRGRPASASSASPTASATMADAASRPRRNLAPARAAGHHTRRGRAPLNAVALVKQVPDRNSAFRPDADRATEDGPVWIDERSLGYGINDYDRYAVEAALRLREDGPVEEVVVVTAGPEEAGQVLRTCLAMGADRAVHLRCERDDLADPFAVAAALSGAVERSGAQIVTAGLLSEDSGHGQVGGLVAGLLGWAWASAVTAIRPEDGRLVVERELDGGRAAVVELRLPAVVAVQTGVNTPRYASLRGIMAARRKPVETLEFGTPPERSGAAGGSFERFLLERPQRAQTAEILTGSAEETAAELVGRIRSGAGITFPGES